MTDTIQPLLERIQNEGLKKSEAERDQILADANAKAESIVNAAHSQAKKIVADAEKSAETTIARGEAALKQSARDLLLKLRTEIGRQVNVAAEKAAASSLDSEEVIRQILPILATSGSGKMSLEAGSDLANKLEAILPSLLKDLGQGAEVVMNPKNGSGFRLHFGESAEAIDFSSRAVADWLSQHLRPELASLLTSVGSGD